MSRRRSLGWCRWWLVAGLLALAMPAPAEPGDADERQRIAKERAAVDQRFQAAQQACEARFASTACLDQARAERRGALEQLRREQLLLDTAQRRQRAADRLRRIQDKQREADARPPAAPMVAASGVQSAAAPGLSRQGAARSARRAEPAASATTPRARVDRPPAAAAPDAAERRAAKRADHDRRQAAFQAHREAVLRRNAERAARQPPAAPLPPRPGLPAASAVAPPAR